MKEKGLILPLGRDCEVLLVNYWRCWGGHRWAYSTESDRTCERCHKRECYEIVDFGRSKCWVWRMPRNVEKQ